MTSEKGGGAPPMPPPCRWASPVGKRTAESGYWGRQRGALGRRAPLPDGRVEACPTAPSPGRGRRDKMAGGGGQGPPRPRRPLLSAPRPDRPESGSRVQVTPARAVGEGAHLPADLDSGAERGAGLPLASSAPSRSPAL